MTYYHRPKKYHIDRRAGQLADHLRLDVETNGDRLISTPEVADIIGMSPQWLNVARMLNIGPAYVKIGRRVLYKISDIVDWLGQRTRKGTEERRPAGRRRKAA